MSSSPLKAAGKKRPAAASPLASPYTKHARAGQADADRQGPSRSAAAAAAHQLQRFERCEYDAAVCYLRRRLLSQQSAEALAMPLRPALQQVHDRMAPMLEKAVSLADQTNTSLLLVGDAGSGKTLVVERALATVAAKFNAPGEKRLGVVRLDGLLHGDERSGFAEIARQLCAEFDQVRCSALQHG